MGQGLVGEPIGQLTLSLGKIVSLVQDDHGVAHIGVEDEDAGVGAKVKYVRFMRNISVHTP